MHRQPIRFYLCRPLAAVGEIACCARNEIGGYAAIGIIACGNIEIALATLGQCLGSKGGEQLCPAGGKVGKVLLQGGVGGYSGVKYTVQGGEPFLEMSEDGGAQWGLGNQIIESSGHEGVPLAAGGTGFDGGEQQVSQVTAEPQVQQGAAQGQARGNKLSAVQRGEVAASRLGVEQLALVEEVEPTGEVAAGLAGIARGGAHNPLLARAPGHD